MQKSEEGIADSGRGLRVTSPDHTTDEVVDVIDPWPSQDGYSPLTAMSAARTEDSLLSVSCSPNWVFRQATPGGCQFDGVRDDTPDTAPSAARKQGGITMSFPVDAWGQTEWDFSIREGDGLSDDGECYDDADDTGPKEYVLLCQPKTNQDSDEEETDNTDVNGGDERNSGAVEGVDIGTCSVLDAVVEETDSLNLAAIDYRQVVEQVLGGLEHDYLTTIRPETDRQYQSPECYTVSVEDHEFAASLFAIGTDVSATTTDVAPHFAATFPDGMIAKPLADIDTKAVRRAVNTISKRDDASHLRSKLRKWEAEQYEIVPSAFVPRSHSLIPQVPLAAFRKSTDKAINASRSLSRSATIAEALCRFDLLRSQSSLVIHILGGDPVIECASVDTVRNAFAPLVRWISVHAECPQHIRIVIVGPDVPAHLAADFIGTGVSRSTSGIDLRPAALGTPGGGSRLRNRLDEATAHCYTGLYHDWVAMDAADVTGAHASNKPDILIAFNAGIWGYDSWLPTLKYLALHNKALFSRELQDVNEKEAFAQEDSMMVPIVITSYTIYEAEDDWDAMQGVLVLQQQPKQSSEQAASTSTLPKCVWEPEINPFGSRLIRPTETAVADRHYRENNAWQAWRLPR